LTAVHQRQIIHFCHGSPELQCRKRINLFALSARYTEIGSANGCYGPSHLNVWIWPTGGTGFGEMVSTKPTAGLY